MTEYKAGHVKRDPGTGAVAIRTVFPEVGPLAVHAWLVATTDSGAVAKVTTDVAGWDDLYTP
jgi:hypothetical protein